MLAYIPTPWILWDMFDQNGSKMINIAHCLW